jgi:dTDP-4-amino-4,6-dideoxygalactose transaminase
MSEQPTISLVPTAAPSRMGDDEAVAVRAAMRRVLDDGPWVGGPAVEEFESVFAAVCGTAHVVGTGNGTDALALAMLALRLPAGSRVLVAANDGGFSATAARMSGLVPLAMDIDVRTMEPTAELAERAWIPSVSALVVTHLHGDPVGLGELDAWRRRRGVTLIEDCAQAHGAAREGRRVGTTGDAATFSFYPTKNLGTVGDAGAVGFADPAAAERARSLRQYGWGARHRAELPGGRNSRMDPMHAAILTARLPWLEARNARRRSIADRYRLAVEGSDLAVLGDSRYTVAHHAIVVSPRRDALTGHLATRGIGTAVHYPYLLNEMPGLEVEGDPTPNAAEWRDRILSVPCFPEMTDGEVDRVVDALRSWDAR